MAIQRFNTCDRKGKRKGFIILDDDHIVSVVAKPTQYWAGSSKVDADSLEVTLALNREIDSQGINGDKLTTYCTEKQGEEMAKVIMKKKKLAAPFHQKAKAKEKDNEDS